MLSSRTCGPEFKLLQSTMMSMLRRTTAKPRWGSARARRSPTLPIATVSSILPSSASSSTPSRCQLKSARSVNRLPMMLMARCSITLRFHALCIASRKSLLRRPLVVTTQVRPRPQDLQSVRRQDQLLARRQDQPVDPLWKHLLLRQARPLARRLLPLLVQLLVPLLAPPPVLR